jgi:thioredoxin-related protein
VKELNRVSFLVSSGFLLVSMMLPNIVAAAELLMFERAGCAWCQRWNREVGSIYPKTKEGQRAVLRRIDLDREMPSNFVLSEPVRYTPTFVLMDNGREIGRLTGYISDDFFWGLLANLLNKLENDRR